MSTQHWNTSQWSNVLSPTAILGNGRQQRFSSASMEQHRVAQYFASTLKLVMTPFTGRFCPNISPPPPPATRFTGWTGARHAARNCSASKQHVWTAWRIHVGWTHTFILHDVVDNLPHRVVFTQGVVHIWYKFQEKKKFWMLVFRSTIMQM